MAKQKKKNVPMRTGNRTMQIQDHFRYRPEKKLRRILRSNGSQAARVWAEKRQGMSALHKLAARKTKLGNLAKQALGR